MSEIEVWILDDEPEHAACVEVRRFAANKQGVVVKVRQASDLREFKEQVAEYQSEQSRLFVLAFIDYSGRGQTTLAVPALDFAQEQLGQEHLMAVLMSDLKRPHEGIDSGALFRTWVEKGGHAYIAKKDITDPDLGKHYLDNTFANAMKMASLWTETLRLREKDRRQQEKEKSQSQMIGSSEALKKTHDLIAEIAHADSEVSTVLVWGETGTGKKLVAQALHYQSRRASGQFAKVDCTSLPPTLFESEMFGYEKGAFTDARVQKKGLCEQAEGGTLFLDEIGDLELGLQSKLLGVLEDRTFRRVGGLKDIPLNAQIIAASHRNLKDECEAGRFRSDLFFRLSVLTIDLPALRDRTEDIPQLIEHFLKTLDKANRIKGVSAQAMKLLQQYSWPGNIRELRNIIERVAILGKNQLIEVEDLPKEVRQLKLKDTQSNGGGWTYFQDNLARWHPDGKPELPDKRMRGRIRLTKNEIDQAQAESKTLDVFREELWRNFFAHLIHDTSGDISTIKDILGNKSEKTVLDAITEYGIKVEQNNEQWVILNQTTTR